ncbi:calcium-binding protein [Prochlorococcus sp. MIT 1306]|uniref:calcium-binding protein n=1 Tax=Prochlorococcus sp. MIT 1306 TaxID=1799667 RepID=UPI0007B37529|nr:calcium-binding protein [Prochlorococcus sp. MIT 1306]KZR66286.1 Poly(beta-D-mannuronate) C5 epimerase 7 [Prochlorococcus sp. MIT 1306]
MTTISIQKSKSQPTQRGGLRYVSIGSGVETYEKRALKVEISHNLQTGETLYWEGHGRGISPEDFITFSQSYGVYGQMLQGSLYGGIKARDSRRNDMGLFFTTKSDGDPDEVLHLDFYSDPERQNLIGRTSTTLKGAPYKTGGGPEPVSPIKAPSNVEVIQNLFANSGGIINDSQSVSGSDININSGNTFVFNDNSLTYNINVTGDINQVTNNVVNNELNVSFRISGTAMADNLKGSVEKALAELLEGGDGNDVLTGFRGADVLSGGNGDDQLRAGNGRDLITGGTGGDSLYGGFGHNTFTGERDGQVDSLYFKSDQFAYNWIYDSASNSPNGEKVDVIKALDAHDQVFVQGVATSELSFGSLSNFSTATGNFSGVGIYANGFLEAIYAGGDLNASQLQAMTSGVPV